MNLRLVYRYIFSSSKKQNKNKNKTKQNNQTKGKKSLLRRESNPRPSKCEVNAYVNMHHDSYNVKQIC